MPRSVRGAPGERSMGNSRDFVDHVLEMMRGAGVAAARAMFGGHGVYLDGLIVGIVVDDVLYLKTDEATRAAYVERGLPPFRYRTHDGALHETGYLRAPDEALESPPAMREWLRGALAASLRAKAAKAPKRRRDTAAGEPPRAAPRARAAKRKVANRR